MRLCDEYLVRNGIEVNYARYIRRGFVYFRGGERLLSIEWNESGAHPGYYDLSECVLETRCRVLSSRRVEWDEYEERLVEWRRSEDIVLDKSLIFDLTWSYFLRRHESVLIREFPLSQIHATIDRRNESRLLECARVLEVLSERAPKAADFWHSKAFDIVSLYCHWIGSL